MEDAKMDFYVLAGAEQTRKIPYGCGVSEECTRKEFEDE
jgi:hypothetical protein